jgi:hypothetical protein
MNIVNHIIVSFINTCQNDKINQKNIIWNDRIESSSSDLNEVNKIVEEIIYLGRIEYLK